LLACAGIHIDDTIAARHLGGIHPGVGLTQQVFLAGSTGTKNHQPDTCGAMMLHRPPTMPFELDQIRRSQTEPYFLCYLQGMTTRRFMTATQLRQQNHELVTADTCHGIGLSYGLSQTFGHLGEQDISGGMTMLVIERFEIVEIKKHQAAIITAAFTGAHDLIEAVMKQPAVGQTGQRIVEGKLLNLLLHRLAFADIGMRTNHAQRSLLRITVDDDASIEYPEIFTTLADDAMLGFINIGLALNMLLDGC